MRQESTQVQLHRDIKSVVITLGRLETEINNIIKLMGNGRDAGLEKGLREVREGRGKLYKTLEEWEAGIRA